MAELNSYVVNGSRTTTTVEDQQYYYNPPSLREIKSITVTIGDVDYELEEVSSQENWNRLNAVEVSSSIPQKYFRREYDYGIWPIPQDDDDTITISYTRNIDPLYFEDYTTGTVAVTENDQTVTITTGNLITGAVKAGFWFSLSDSNGEPRGSWYRIGSITDTTHMELETYFEESAESGATYIIGQVPELLDEGMLLPAYGALADYFMLKRNDFEKGTRFNNVFWTGNPNITQLQVQGNKSWSGGLIGLVNSYRDRSSSVVVDRGNRSSSDNIPLEWGITLT